MCADGMSEPTPGARALEAFVAVVASEAKIRELRELDLEALAATFVFGVKKGLITTTWDEILAGVREWQGTPERQKWTVPTSAAGRQGKAKRAKERRGAAESARESQKKAPESEEGRSQKTPGTERQGDSKDKGAGAAATSEQKRGETEGYGGGEAEPRGAPPRPRPAGRQGKGQGGAPRAKELVALGKTGEATSGGQQQGHN